MIGIDTNVLVRYLTQDDEKQAAIVNKVINQYENQAQSIFINNIVICELIWVLERGYKYSKKEITDSVRAILSTTEFVFEKPEILWLSLNDYEKYNADFSDILLGKINRRYGCISTITFDNKAAILKEFSGPKIFYSKG
ncbi:PIN domain-containing protein [Rickettsia endosymbiont of Halotydeus destructor]|uniref:PIN domain-containing protein n=1 Tax=Rickettsia endosymbiont of Halotydeus destructor TaxID=2996754 RepID=UPI003BAE2AD2